MTADELNIHRFQIRASIRLLTEKMGEFDKATKRRAEDTILNLQRQINSPGVCLVKLGARP